MRQVIGLLLLTSVLAGCTAYGQFVDTVTDPMVKAQQAAQQKRAAQAKGQPYAPPPLQHP